MTVAMRRGACPALSAPMQTGDGLLVRLNLAENGIPPAVLRALCEAAARHGSGLIEVTARGSLQIRGLTAASAPLLAAEVGLLDIPVREGVPVETSPLAGLDPDEIADPRPLVRTIRAAIGAAGLVSRLGPKVSVVVDGGGRIDFAPILADVRLSAVRLDGTVRWRVAAGGNATAATPVLLVGEEDAAAAILSILEAVAALGRTGRARDLPPQMLAEIAASFPGSHSLLPSSVVPENGRDTLQLPLTDGRFAVPVSLPFGSVHARQLNQFLSLAAAQGAAEIRLAPARTLLVLCPSAVSARAVQEEAGNAGFVVDAADPRRAISACPGAPACAFGHIAARDIAAMLAAECGDLLDGSLPVHVSGCAKGCAHPSAAALTLVGEPGACALVINGTASCEAASRASINEIPAALRRLAALLRQSRREGETAENVFQRLDAAALAQAFRKGRR